MVNTRIVVVKCSPSNVHLKTEASYFTGSNISC